MNERDELAEVIALSNGWTAEHLRVRAYVADQYRKMADAVLAAGYRKPAVVATVDELKSLPDKSVVLDSLGCVARCDTGVWYCPGSEWFVHPEAIALPAIVLYRGEAGE